MPGMPGAEQPGSGGDTHHAIYFPDLSGTAGHTAIPNSVLDDGQLGPETRLVYVMLRRLAATTRAPTVGQREVAERIGVPAHRIPRHLTLLQRRGLIGVVARPSSRAPVRYSLQEPAGSDGDPFVRPPAVRPGRATKGTARLSLVDRLIVLGVDPQVAERLVASYPKERVAGALRAAHRHRPKPRDLAAWVVAAICQGRVAQSAATVAHERQAAQEAAIAAWERRTDAALATLPTQTQESLRRQATEIVEQRFNRRIAASTIGTMLVTVELRLLVAEQVGIPVPY